MDIANTNFGRQVSIGFVGRAVTLAVAFLGSIVLARALGPAGYGSFYVLMSIVAVLDNPVTGWTTACRKRFAETDQSNAAALGAMLLGLLVGSLGFALVAVLAAPLLEQHVDVDRPVLALAGLFAASVAFSGLTAMVKSTSRFGSGTWLEALRDLVRVPSQITLVALGFGVLGMAGGIAAANLLTALVSFALIRVRPSLPSLSLLRDTWSFAKSSIPDTFFGRALDRMDTLLLGFLASSTAAGYYEIGWRLTMPAMFVAGVAAGGLMARISNLHSDGEPVVHDVQNNLSYGSLVAIPLFFGALVIAEPVVATTYGAEYESASLFLVGLALYRVVKSQESILISVLNGLDRPELNLRTSMVIFAVNLSLGVTLLEFVGPLGVVVATVVSAVISYVIRALYLTRLVPDVALLPRPLLEQTACGVLMAGVVYGGRLFVKPNSAVRVVALVALGGAVYFGALLFLSSSFRTTVRSVVQPDEA